MLLVGLAVGTTVGWKLTSIRARDNCLFFLNGMARSEIHAQEMASTDAYLNDSPEVAIWAMNDLLATYGRLSHAPHPHPEEQAERTRFATAMAHARLARLYGQLGQADKQRIHEAKALDLGNFTNADDMQARMNALDKAQEKQLGQQ